MGVTCVWMPLLPFGSPMPGVGAITPIPAGAPAGAVPTSGLFGNWAVPAGGVGTLAAGAAAAGAVWAGGLADACAAAGVSQAAAKAIAHPIRFISTPVASLEPKAQVRDFELRAL